MLKFVDVKKGPRKRKRAVPVPSTHQKKGSKTSLEDDDQPQLLRFFKREGTGAPSSPLSQPNGTEKGDIASRKGIQKQDSVCDSALKICASHNLMVDCSDVSDERSGKLHVVTEKFECGSPTKTRHRSRTNVVPTRTSPQEDVAQHIVVFDNGDTTLESAEATTLAVPRGSLTKPERSPDIETERPKKDEFCPHSCPAQLNMGKSAQQDTQGTVLTSKKEEDDKDMATGLLVVREISPSSAQAIDTALSEYERRRLEKIEKNRQMMTALGLDQASLVSSTRAIKHSVEGKDVGQKRKSKKWPKKDYSIASLGQRRSARLRGKPAVNVSGGELIDEKASLQHASDDDSAPDVDDPALYDSSSVFRYICVDGDQSNPCQGDTDNEGGSRAADGKLASKQQVESALAQSGEVRGFRFFRGRPTLHSSDSLKRTYSMQFRPLHNDLLVAGGHGGMVVVHGVRNNSGQHDPLMTFKAHKGWISGVQFVESSASHSLNEGDFRSVRLAQGETSGIKPERTLPQTNDEPLHKKTLPNLRILTSSNDGYVSLWDITQQKAMGRSWCPRQLDKHAPHHGAGIFSLHCSWPDQILSGSKDSTVALSVISNAGIQRLRTLQLHDSVVKCVRFRGMDSAVFASCSNDKSIAVSDLREGHSSAEQQFRSALRIENAHNQAINSVRWHPTSPNILASTSFDPFIHLWDLRKTDSPILTFSGHVAASARVKKIYHPTFVDGGRKILVGGNGYKLLSLYDTASGETVSRGQLGFEPTAIEAEKDGSERIAIAHGGEINLMEPIRG